MEKLKKRNEIDEKYQWDLSGMIKDDKHFNETYKEIEILADQLVAYKGTLNQGVDTIKKMP